MARIDLCHVLAQTWLAVGGTNRAPAEKEEGYRDKQTGGKGAVVVCRLNASTLTFETGEPLSASPRRSGLLERACVASNKVEDGT